MPYGRKGKKFRGKAVSVTETRRGARRGTSRRGTARRGITRGGNTGMGGGPIGDPCPPGGTMVDCGINGYICDYGDPNFQCPYVNPGEPGPGYNPNIPGGDISQAGTLPGGMQAAGVQPRIPRKPRIPRTPVVPGAQGQCYCECARINHPENIYFSGIIGSCLNPGQHCDDQCTSYCDSQTYFQGPLAGQPNMQFSWSQCY